MSDKENINTNCSSNVCANCGKEGSHITNSCNKCNSVIYCNAVCKKKHRHKHKKECERRVAELHDEKLFKKPPPKEDDCPICFLRMPALGSGATYLNCCGKIVCNGCLHAIQSRAIDTGKDDDDVCPFCRTPSPREITQAIARIKKRAELNDPRAIHNLGSHYNDGDGGLHQDRAKALKLWHRAAELGSTKSYYNIGRAYYNGLGVERDIKKAKYYNELAALGGDETARYKLGIIEGNAGNMDRALKHFTIAAADGCKDALKGVYKLHSIGAATKDDYAKALRSYQVYIDEIKTDQRDEADAAYEDGMYRYY